MARGYCRVVLVGNLGGEPEMKYLPNGDPVTSFSIAVNRRQKVNGEYRDETDWYRVSCYRKTAEIASQYLKKGQSVLIDGRLSIRRYTGNDGIERTSVDVNCDQLHLLGDRQDGDIRSESEDSDVPF